MERSRADFEEKPDPWRALIISAHRNRLRISRQHHDQRRAWYATVRIPLLDKPSPKREARHGRSRDGPFFCLVDFHRELTRHFHREVTRLSCMFRFGVDGQGSGFLLRFFRLVCGAVFEPEAVVPGFQDVAMVGQSVEKRGRHLGIAEDTGPLTEAEVCGDDDACAFVEFAQQMEEQCST